jgi:hypothetical protein
MGVATLARDRRFDPAAAARRALLPRAKRRRTFSGERRNSFEVRTILPTAPGSAARDGCREYFDECAPRRRHDPAPTRSIFEGFWEPTEEGPLPAILPRTRKKKTPPDSLPGGV